MDMEEMSLDLKGSCFLCLASPSNTASSGTDTGPECPLTEQSLQNICRFLNINSQFLTLGKSCGELSTNSNKLQECQFAVKLCTTCSVATNKLSLLCKELEMIESMITHQFQNFNNILSVASHAENSKEVTSQTLGNIETDTIVVKTFRKEIHDKCHAFLKRRSINLPQSPVKLAMFDNDIPGNRKRVHTPAPSDTHTARDEQHHGYEDSPRTKKMCPGSPFPSMSVDNASPASTESLTYTENSYNSMEDEDSSLDLSQYKCFRMGDRFQCPFCGDLFSDPGGYSPSPDNIDFHLVVKHLEKLLCLKTTPNFSATLFQLLWRQVITSSPIQQQNSFSSSDTGNESNFYICSVCNKDHKTLENASFHFVVEHFRILQKRLSEIQKMNIMDNISSVCKVEPPPFNIASVLDWNNKSCQQVEKVAYPSTTTSEFAFDLSTKESTDYTNQMFNQQSKGTDLGGMSLYEFTNEIGDKMQCTFCEAKFGKGKSSASAIRLHVACFHPEKLFMYKKLPQIDNLAFSDICRKLVKTELETARFSGVGGNDRNNSILSCSNCNKTFTRMHNLKYHCVNTHFQILSEKLVKLQQTFLKENPLGNDAGGLGNGVIPPPSSAASPLEQHQWQQFINEEQTKPTASTVATPTPAQESLLSFPNYSFNNSGSVQQSSYYNTSSENPTAAPIEMTLKSSDINPPPHPINTEPLPIEGLYHPSYFHQGIFQNSTTTLPSPYSHIFNSGWLSPATQSYFHARAPPHQVEISDRDTVYPEDQQSYTDQDKNNKTEQMDLDPDSFCDTDMVSSFPNYLNILGKSINQSASEGDTIKGN